MGNAQTAGFKNGGEGKNMNELDFFLTASIFACLGYGLCYMAMAKPSRQKTDNNHSQDDFLNSFSLSEYGEQQ